MIHHDFIWRAENGSRSFVWMNPQPSAISVSEKVLFERDTNVSLVNFHTVWRADRFSTPPMSFVVIDEWFEIVHNSVGNPRSQPGRGELN